MGCVALGKLLAFSEAQVTTQMDTEGVGHLLEETQAFHLPFSPSCS